MIDTANANWADLVLAISNPSSIIAARELT